MLLGCFLSLHCTAVCCVDCAGVEGAQFTHCSCFEGSLVISLLCPCIARTHACTHAVYSKNARTHARSHARTLARSHAHIHARTRARAYKHTHSLVSLLLLACLLTNRSRTRWRAHGHATHKQAGARGVLRRIVGWEHLICLCRCHPCCCCCCCCSCHALGSGGRGAWG